MLWAEGMDLNTLLATAQATWPRLTWVIDRADDSANARIGDKHDVSAEHDGECFCVWIYDGPGSDYGFSSRGFGRTLSAAARLARKHYPFCTKFLDLETEPEEET